VTRARAGRHGEWDFPYEPSSVLCGADEAGETDIVIATEGDVEETTLGELLADMMPRVEKLIARAPLFWTRVRSSASRSTSEVAGILSRAGVAVRYATPSRGGRMDLPPPLDLSACERAGATSWRSRPARPVPPGSNSTGHWFLGETGGGIRVDRRVCGTGAGTRLAVIDDEIADIDHVELDQVVLVGVTRAPATTGHAALMTAWAVGSAPRDGKQFAGVAPDASPRLYCIPKPGVDVVSLPLAIARAVFDGADVVVCATYVEGSSSPLLDDALDVATRLGRHGRGTVVVLPTGRETSSGATSVHASLSLGLGDPASDPRVHCIAPGGRQGGWFLWSSPRGKLRPFSNRGPAVRWLAPGDDIAYPFSSKDRLFHAESSGASAIAAGVMLLLLGSNPQLMFHEVHALLARTADTPEHDHALIPQLADPVDMLPLGRDADRHNAKDGYGRMNAGRACACASDPIALELMAMGEGELAVAWAGAERERRPYSAELANWASQKLLARPDLEHAARAILRHARLVAAEPSRAASHRPGALARQLAILVRELEGAEPSQKVREELRHAAKALRDATTGGDPSEETLKDGIARLFGRRGPVVAPPADFHRDSISSAGVQS
jgi:hypothetical protein